MNDDKKNLTFAKTCTFDMPDEEIAEWDEDPTYMCNEFDLQIEKLFPGVPTSGLEVRSDKVDKAIARGDTTVQLDVWFEYDAFLGNVFSVVLF